MATSSPKEKRRSTRRSAHSSSKSSGSGSPSPDAVPHAAPPALSDAARSAASSSSSSTARPKRAKEDADNSHPPASHSHRRTASVASAINGALSVPAPAPSKRTKRKGKEIVVPNDDLTDTPSTGAAEKVIEAATDGGKEEEDGGITRCVCEGLDDDADAPDFMIQCELCMAWQHGPCMGFLSESEIPEGDYYCERCKPEDHVELLKKLARRHRHSSEKSVLASQRSRTSRSHSPSHFLKTAKRRNTMNSRDAAYEESIQELLDATAAEAVPNADTPAKEATDNVAKTEEPYEEVLEIGPGGRKKRKRADDDAMPTKRKRSTSLISDGVGSTAAGQDKVEATTPITTALLPPPLPVGKSRARRAGGRKSAAAREPSVIGEGEDAGAPTTKKHPNQYTYRTKSSNGLSRRAPSSATGQNNISTHDHGTRRNANNVANSGASSGGTRTSHNAYYNNVQLPMFMSWGLPDYLAHLQSILPSEVPPPLQIRGARSFLREDVGGPGADSGDTSTSAMGSRASMGPPAGDMTDGQTAQMVNDTENATDSVTERGVKVKWPAKRMSVADMNKRVRALVEWVGREQALALDRERRKLAVENAMRVNLEARRTTLDVEFAQENPKVAESPSDEAPPVVSAMLDRPREQEQDAEPEPDRAGTPKCTNDPLSNTSIKSQSTSKTMEELMEELINFQERFGPGVKGQGRDRRVVALS